MIGSELAPQSTMPEVLRQQFEASGNDDLIVSSGLDLPKISIKGKEFTVVKGEDRHIIDLPHLNMVILGISPAGKATAKTFYKKAFDDDGEVTMPDCYSYDGVKPDVSCSNKQSVSCANCPHNVFGSGLKQDGSPGKGKRCQDNKILFVAAPDDIDGDIYILRVPPSSFKAMGQYANKLNQHKVVRSGCITKMSFMRGVSHPQLVFSFGGYMDEATTIKALTRANSDEVAQLISSGTAFSDDSVTEDDIPPPPEFAKEATTAAEVEEKVAEVVASSDEELDINGEPWDAALHSSSKTRTAGGAWRKRKVVAKEKPAGDATSIFKESAAPATREPEPKTEYEDLDDADLDAWLSDL